MTTDLRTLFHRHVCQTSIVQEAWERGQSLSVHGWIYGLHDGRLRNLGLSASRLSDLSTTYPLALAEIGGVRNTQHRDV